MKLLRSANIIRRCGYRYTANSGNPRVLVTGCLGQIGTNLVGALRSKFGPENVVASDVHIPTSQTILAGKYKYLNVLKIDDFYRMVVDERIDWLFHMPAIMSVLGEQVPTKALELNVDGTRNALEVALKYKLRVFFPSTMGVFGADCGKVKTKDDTILNPSTIYGVTKVFAEGLGKWASQKYGLDFRSIRIGGVLAPETLPGGGTTDYSVHMIHSALKGEPYVCPVLPDEPLPMIYIDDCIRGIIELMCAPSENLSRRVYNIQGLSFTPREIQACIKRIHGFSDVKYVRGLAQDIAHSWPDSMDDTNAQHDWDWKPQFNLENVVKAMLQDVPKFHKIKK